MNMKGIYFIFAEAFYLVQDHPPFLFSLKNLNYFYIFWCVIHSGFRIILRPSPFCPQVAHIFLEMKYPPRDIKLNTKL